MKPFYMLAGSVATDLALEQIQRLLAELGIDSVFEEDELLLSGPTNLLFRDGFDHEYIVVGDAPDMTTLVEGCRTLSNALKEMKMAHGFELYDTQNQLFEQIDFTPG